MRLGARQRQLRLSRRPPRDDLRNAVAAHGHAIKKIGGFHRALLMRDHDELGPVGVAAQQFDEAADVGFVQRGLDLVKQVERAGVGQEEGKEEADRSQ